MTENLMKEFEKAIQDISENHRKIIDDVMNLLKIEMEYKRPKPNKIYKIKVRVVKIMKGKPHSYE
jgi:hypothetical protein